MQTLLKENYSKDILACKTKMLQKCFQIVKSSKFKTTWELRFLDVLKIGSGTPEAHFEYYLELIWNEKSY